jgi:hypothetical protein
MTTPYENATSGVAAGDEITKLLRRFGCDSIGFMDDFERCALLLAFRHRGGVCSCAPAPRAGPRCT